MVPGKLFPNLQAPTLFVQHQSLSWDPKLRKRWLNAIDCYQRAIAIAPGNKSLLSLETLLFYKKKKWRPKDKTEK